MMAHLDTTDNTQTNDSLHDQGHVIDHIENNSMWPKVYVVIYQTSQNFIMIMNLQVTFYLVKVGFFQFCSMTAGCYFNDQLLYTAFC